MNKCCEKCGKEMLISGQWAICVDCWYKVRHQPPKSEKCEQPFGANCEMGNCACAKTPKHTHPTRNFVDGCPACYPAQPSPASKSEKCGVEVETDNKDYYDCQNTKPCPDHNPSPASTEGLDKNPFEMSVEELDQTVERLGLKDLLDSLAEEADEDHTLTGFKRSFAPWIISFFTDKITQATEAGYQKGKREWYDKAHASGLEQAANNVKQAIPEARSQLKADILRVVEESKTTGEEMPKKSYERARGYNQCLADLSQKIKEL